MMGCQDHAWLQYEWNDSRVLCSMGIDDLSGGASQDDVDEQIDVAVENQSVALVHAHAPGVTVSMAALEHALQTAVDHGLELVTYPELSAGPKRAAMALGFDDSSVDLWYGIRDLLASYGARVTFFATRYDMWSEDQKVMLHELAAQGHAVEAHTVQHLHAVEYLKSHSLDDYMTDEVVPSIEILEADGYAVDSFAFPFGESTDALDDKVLQVVPRVRVGIGSCPDRR